MLIDRSNRNASRAPRPAPASRGSSRARSRAGALAIGGLDPGGGAGIAADLRAFTAAGAFGCAALAVLTVQSTGGLRSARPVPARELSAQVLEVRKAQRVASVKVGALGGRQNVHAVARLLSKYPRVPVVIDTPMTPPLGTGRLLAAGALAAMREELAPRATLLTANIDEVFALLGGRARDRVRTIAEARDAALALCALGARSALVKGGHLAGTKAIDVLAIDGELIELSAPRLAIPPTHGTGCTFASLVAGRLAVREQRGDRGDPVERDTLVAAVRWAKRVHHAALTCTVDVSAA